MQLGGSPELAAAIDRALEGFARDDRPGAFVAVMRRGDLIHLWGYGAADLAFSTGWSPDTRYRLASVTKTFTATAIMDLVEQGRIDVDAPVTRYLPGLSPVAEAIHIGDLLTMSSGLWQDEDIMELTGNALVAAGGPEAHMSVADMEAYAAIQERLDFRPGTRYRYIDTNYRLLARVIERVTGLAYAQALEELVLAPAGMRHSAPYPTLDSTFACQVPTYIWSGDHWQDIGEYALAASGDGAMISTMRDMIAWMRYMSAVRGDGRPSRFMRQADPDNRFARPAAIYRLGIMVYRHRGYTVLVHTGATGTLYAHVPDLELSIVIFSNGLGGETGTPRRPRDLAALVIDAVLDDGEHKFDRAPAFAATAGALPLAYAPLPSGNFPVGTFVCEASGEVLEITEDGPLARVTLMGMSPTTWAAGSDGSWQGMASHLHVEMKAVTSSPGGVAAVELRELNADDSCRFAAIEPGSLAAAEAKQLAGWYYSDTLTTHYRISVEDDVAYLTAPSGVHSGEARALVRLSRDSLRAGSLFLRLSRDGKGEVRGFSVSIGRVRNAPFRRIKP